MSGHGNISIKVPGRDEILYTAAASLPNFSEEGIARLRLDGTVLEGEVSPMAAAVISMHVAIYEEKPETGCVLHTHSPFATAFAVANRPLEGWTEAFGIFGLVYWIGHGNFPGPLFLGGLVLFVLGLQGFLMAVVGENLQRIQRDVEGRPLYYIERELG